MKIIDLLNKIANGEVDIKKIKYDNQVFEYREDMMDYYCYDYDLNLMGYQKALNDEVEILEEEKKIPEKIKVKDYDKCIHDVTHKEKEFSLDIRELQIRYNDLLDYLKSKGDE